MAMIRKIISGGQTGADQGALAAAKQLGIATGGWMPKGFRTEAGPRPEFAELYGMRETLSIGYPPRTAMNVHESDGTLIFGNIDTPGCRLTLNRCEVMHNWWWHRPFPLGVIYHPIDRPEEFLAWLNAHRIKILNVAGNREERNPGIHDAVYQFLLEALR